MLSFVGVLPTKNVIIAGKSAAIVKLQPQSQQNIFLP